MKIAVLFGGQSSERDVSISSASQVYKALKESGHDVIAIDTAMGLVKSEDEEAFLNCRIAPLPPEISGLKMLQNGLMPLVQSGKLADRDVCFLALHGGNGENGMMQGFLDILGIPYTGPDHKSSACSMDKDITKTLFLRHGVPTPKWMMMPVSKEDAIDALGLPLIVKPNSEGSTVGLTVVKNEADFDGAVELASKYDKEVMIEQFIPGREFTVGVLDGQPLAAGEIIPKLSEIFDYKSKYMPGGSEEIFPAPIDEELSDKMRKIALDAAKAAKIDSYCRVDFRVDDAGNPYVLEINTLPGMTSASLLPKSAKAVGISFVQLCEKICTLALKRYDR